MDERGIPYQMSLHELLDKNPSETGQQGNGGKPEPVQKDKPAEVSGEQGGTGSPEKKRRNGWVYVPKESRMQEREQEEQARKREEAQKRYQYFDGDAILASMQFTPDQLKGGRELIRKRNITVKNVSTTYGLLGGELTGQITGTSENGGKEIRTVIRFDRTESVSSECSCPKCKRRYSYWMDDICRCEYTAALALELQDYLLDHVLGDATDQAGNSLIRAFQKPKLQTGSPAGNTAEGSLRLVPSLVMKDGELRLTFRVGREKLFVIKNLSRFCRDVKEGADATYGTKTTFCHAVSNFCEEARAWLRFLQKVVQDEYEWVALRVGYDYGEDDITSLERYILLAGWRLDAFFQEMGDRPFEYEDRDGLSTVKGTLTCVQEDPRGTLQLSAWQPEEDDEIRAIHAPGRRKKKAKAAETVNDEVFHGLLAQGRLPELFYGAESAYYVKDKHFCRVSKEFLYSMLPLRRLAEDDCLFFRVGRNNLGDFYDRVYPALEKVFTITETEPERFRSYLPPKAKFRFWLDADGGEISCRPEVLYGEQSFSLTGLGEKNREDLLAQQRDADGELAVLDRMKAWFPIEDVRRGLFLLDEETDPDGVVRLLKDGVNELLSLGEVQATQKFRGKQEFRRVRLSVGVSVSGGLLDLDIETEDMTPQELLDILKDYRAKKHYFRLKSGSYVDLEDPSLAMMSELMDAAHLLPKDFLKGKLHIPLFRTLYLDRLLEEHSEVYSDRDAHFRSIVKGFKTINEADFEVPATLKKVLRGYQKVGYRWLRTLETWGFGGILADDMGLGKTVQVISVLLAAKQEGRAGVSLVVTPASLVFNWGEEFRRFAPELGVRLVAGTHAERRKILEQAWQDGTDVLVTSYDLLKRDVALYEEKDFLYEVIDEAQYIKNHTTAAAKAVKVIHSKIRFALTGTPIENRLSELWSIFDYLMPGFLYGYETFRRDIETPAVKYQDKDAMKRLQKLTGPFILRRLKEQVLKDLPEKLEENCYVSFGEEQRKLYDAQVVYMKTLLSGKSETEFNQSRIQILAELTKLRQICCDPSLCFEEFRGNSAKGDACLELVRNAVDGGHRLLLFSQFTSLLDILKQRLTQEGIDFFTITGATGKQERLELVKRFNEGDTPVFLISLKAGGVGLNLTGADVVIHYDPWWNLAAQNQATDRAHRIGQTKKVTVYKLLVKGTVEEKIQELQEKKKDLAEQVMGGGTGQPAGMSREQLLELLES